MEPQHGVRVFELPSRSYVISIRCSVTVVKGGLGGHDDPDLPALEVDAVEPPKRGVGGGSLLVFDYAVSLGHVSLVRVDADGERPLVLVAPLLCSAER